ncbi:MAG: hypothetical protein MK322_13405 [Pseudomonadales bacterium]|jgi:hypothetical protein|nr:hypothetical protein [Pseudomonadales bacterium]|tara:strand:+ start:1902 stop:2180 length:279 start_codon:yes stop_codon:yes gene_type:complete
MTTILDPTDERVPIERSITPRSEEITGTLALLDISKPRGNVLLDQLAIRLAERLPNVSIERFSKPTFTKPAPAELRQEIKEKADFVVEALAD